MQIYKFNWLCAFLHHLVFCKNSLKPERISQYNILKWVVLNSFASCEKKAYLKQLVKWLCELNCYPQLRYQMLVSYKIRNNYRKNQFWSSASSLSSIILSTTLSSTVLYVVYHINKYQGSDLWWWCYYNISLQNCKQLSTHMNRDHTDNRQQ